MTTIVWDGKYLAADSAVTWGDGEARIKTNTVSKLVHNPNRDAIINGSAVTWIVGTGNVSRISVLTDMVLKSRGEIARLFGGRQIEKPSCALYLLTEDNKLYELAYTASKGFYRGSVKLIELLPKHVIAFGSGSNHMQTARLFNLADARDVALLITHIDQGSGGPIHFTTVTATHYRKTSTFTAKGKAVALASVKCTFKITEAI